ncbi:Protein kinase family protein [Rhynchospora pubera]|uniref:Protein kinase family protein n=1 Tax=Rhynchospora pubera TaxID=906938 RepID=A0AAV8CDW6_9POAL|nr:Protein kinase family protein [Rhynchospora pubera]
MRFLNLLIFFILYCHVQVSGSSSCKELQNIIHHLPGSCGGKRFQLYCNGINPIFNIQSTNFLLKDISFQNQTFRLVDPYLDTGDYCHLPNQTYSENYDAPFFYVYSNYSYIYFLNCTQAIENLEYEMIPCMNTMNSRVYAVTTRSYYVSDVPDSCRLVGRAIADHPSERMDSGTIMQVIQKGVLVNWTAENVNSWSLTCSILEKCWRFQVSYYLQYIKEAMMSKDLSVSNKIVTVFLLIPPFFIEQLFFLWCLYAGSTVIFCFMLILLALMDIILLSLGARLVLAPLAICSFLIHKYRRVTPSISSIEKFLRENEMLSIRRYDFIEIAIMTNHFRQKLGQGGFGSVYRGKLFSGNQVAIKILSNLVGDGDDFISEVATIGRIHHANIVRLIGFCSESSKRALVYDYMPNGSLDKYIFSSNNNALSMRKRREIALGIARGIDYLHRGCEMQILHFDIKPHNILLDHDLTPKISDFGLARMYPREHHLVALTAARGTIGYIAPELISRTFGVISYKADVYSFGMLLMEMASGRRNVDNHAGSSSQVYYPSWIYDQLKLAEEHYDWSNCVAEFGEIEWILYKVALWCIQMRASDRPSMSRVIEMLQSDADSLEMPPRPFTTCSHQETSIELSEIESCSIEVSEFTEEISLL